MIGDERLQLQSHYWKPPKGIPEKRKRKWKLGHKIHRIWKLKGPIALVVSLEVTPLVSHIAPYPVSFFHQLLPNS